MPLTDIKLGTAIESVEAHVSQGGMNFRVVVPAEALQRHFGAGDISQSWLEAFLTNAPAIEKVALRVFLASPRSPIILNAFETRGKAK